MVYQQEETRVYTMMKHLLNKLHAMLNMTRSADFIGPLALRLYLVPVFWMAGSKKLANMDSTIEWFANPTGD